VVRLWVPTQSNVYLELRNIKRFIAQRPTRTFYLQPDCSVTCLRDILYQAISERRSDAWTV